MNQISRRTMLLGAASTIGASFLAADRFYGFLPEANDEIAFSDFLDRANKDEFSDIFITDDLLIGKTRTGFVLETQTTLSTEQNLSYFEKGNTNIWLQSPQNTFEKWVKPAAMSITAVSLVYGGKSLFNDLNKSRSQAQFKEALHEDQIRSTAHHEAGHAIVGLAKPGIYTVGEATIKPEAGMFGHIDAMHRTKIKSHTKETLDNTVAMLMAGRAAEQVAFGDNKYGVGARADIDMAKKIATDMVLSYGMSEELGNTPHLPSIFDGMRPLQFLFMTSSKRQLVDTAVKNIMDQGLRTAVSVIEQNRQQFDNLANALLDRERLSPKEIREITGLYDPDDHHQFEGFEPPKTT